MKITIQTIDLKKALVLVGKAVSSKPHLPILSGILLSVKNGVASLMATDLEMSFWVKLFGSVEGEGEVVIPAKIFSELVASLPLGKIDLEAEDGKIRLKSLGVDSEVLCQVADDFPSIPRASKAQLKINSKVFSEKMTKVAVSSAKDESRPVLTGILWEVEGTELILAATDGFRLGMDKVKLEENSLSEKVKFVVPAKSLMELVRALSETEGGEFGVEVDKENHQVVFSLGEVEISSRMIEGEFPPFRQIIPNTYKLKMSLPKESLVSAVKRASLFAKDQANVIKIEVEENKLKVMSENTQIGKNVSEVEAETEGGAMSMAFNARYLLEYLAVVESEMIDWETEGELKPSVFRSGKDSEWLQVIMPIRVQG